jgi:hypothetical protein
MWLLRTDCTCIHNCTHERGFIWLRRCLTRSLIIWLTFLWLSTALKAAAQTLFCACNVQPSVRLHCAADSATNTARSFAGKDTNTRLMFRARWTVLLPHVTAAQCLSVRIVCVFFRARAHSRVPRRHSADEITVGAGLRALCPVVLTCFSAWQVGVFLGWRRITCQACCRVSTGQRAPPA